MMMPTSNHEWLLSLMTKPHLIMPDRHLAVVLYAQGFIPRPDQRSSLCAEYRSSPATSTPSRRSPCRSPTPTDRGARINPGSLTQKMIKKHQLMDQNTTVHRHPHSPETRWRFSRGCRWVGSYSRERNRRCNRWCNHRSAPIPTPKPGRGPGNSHIRIHRIGPTGRGSP